MATPKKAFARLFTFLLLLGARKPPPHWRTARCFQDPPGSGWRVEQVGALCPMSHPRSLLSVLPFLLPSSFLFLVGCPGQRGGLCPTEPGLSRCTRHWHGLTRGLGVTHAGVSLQHSTRPCPSWAVKHSNKIPLARGVQRGRQSFGLLLRQM